MTKEKERRKLAAAIQEMVGLLTSDEMADLIEYIKDMMRRKAG